MTYHPRLIDKNLLEWANSREHKPILLRGARQVGKSSAVRHLAKNFKNYIEINFEKNPEYKEIFLPNLEIERILNQISILKGVPISDKETLLFLDEIQECPRAIMALRFFKEDRPELHVIGAGSLLEFALEDLPTFGVGRIHSMFLYPMTFDEFLMALGEERLTEERNKATWLSPLPNIIHDKLVDYFRNYIIIGGMPEVVDSWVKYKDYLICQEKQDDLLSGYEADFAKYKKKIDPLLLRNTLRSVAIQLTEKFTYSAVAGNYKIYDIKKALKLLTQAGLVIPIVKTSANGVPLGSETDESYQKILLLDSGLTLRLLNLSYGDVTSLISDILHSPSNELVNKGPMAEMVAGLELLRYQNPNIRHDLYYWAKQERNSSAEVDYIMSYHGEILPIEVKSGVQGGMKSMWMFMELKHLKRGVRSSLENFGILYKNNVEGTSNNKLEVIICPLYSLSQLNRVLAFTSND